jgi:hypothetical protein
MGEQAAQGGPRHDAVWIRPGCYRNRRSSRGNCDVAVMQDRSTKWVLCRAVRKATARTVARPPSSQPTAPALWWNDPHRSRPNSEAPAREPRNPAPGTAAQPASPSRPELQHLDRPTWKQLPGTFTTRRSGGSQALRVRPTGTTTPPARVLMLEVSRVNSDWFKLMLGKLLGRVFDSAPSQFLLIKIGQ